MDLSREGSGIGGITGADRRRRFRSRGQLHTYMHYITIFADRNGIEYVILDDGWAADNGEDLMNKSEIDLPAIIACP